jgi:hypothetical protein
VFAQAFDFGDGNGGLLTPSDYDSMMYAPAHDAGARISCNSWGSVGMNSLIPFLFMSLRI